MKYQAWILILTTLLVVAQSSYNFKNSQDFYEYNVMSFALAPSTVTGTSFNLALGLLNGSVVLTSTENYSFRMTYPLHTIAVTVMDWSPMGIFTVTFNQVKLFDPVRSVTRLTLNPVNQVMFAAVAPSANPYIITAVSFTDRIQIYQDSTLYMTRPTTTTCKAFTFDLTGKYFYYFDGSTRYIINVPNRSVYNSYYSAVNPVQILASTRSGREDITVTIDNQGAVKIWDDYNLLDTYTRFYSQTMGDFTQDCQYFVSYQDADDKVIVWKTDFVNFGNWGTSQEFQLNQVTSITKSLKAKNNMIAYLGVNTIYVYAWTDDSTPTSTILIIVFSVLGFIILVGCVAFFIKRKITMNKRNQNNYQNFDNNQPYSGPIPNQGFNNQGFNNNNPPYGNNQGFNNQGFNNQGFNNNQGFSNQPYNNQGYNNQGYNNQGYNNNQSNPYGGNPYAS